MMLALVGSSGCAELASPQGWPGSSGGAGATGATGGHGGFAASGGGGGSAGAGASDAITDPSLVWARSLGGPGTDTPYDVAVNGSGRIAVVGRCAAGLRVEGSDVLPSEDDDAGYLVLFDPSGDGPQTHLLTGADNQRFEGVAFRNDEIFLAGVTHATPQFDGTQLETSSGSADALALSIAASGEILWDELWGDDNQQYATSISVDGTDLVVGGFFQGTIDVGLGNPATAQAEDGFVARMKTTDGAFGALLKIGGSEKTYANNVAMLPSTDVLVGSIYQGSFDLDRDMPDADVEGDAYVGEIDSNGYAVDWLLQVGGAGLTSVAAVAAAPDGWAVAGGRFDSQLSIADRPMVASKGGSDAFVARLAPGTGGSIEWMWTLAGAGDEWVHDVAVGSNGTVAVGGQCVGCGGVGGDGSDADDGFVALLDSTGALIWFLHVGGPGVQIVDSVAVTGNGDVVLAGQFEGSLDVLGAPFSSLGQRDTFVARIARAR